MSEKRTRCDGRLANLERLEAIGRAAHQREKAAFPLAVAGLRGRMEGGLSIRVDYLLRAWRAFLWAQPSQAAT